MFGVNGRRIPLFFSFKELERSRCQGRRLLQRSRGLLDVCTNIQICIGLILLAFLAQVWFGVVTILA